MNDKIINQIYTWLEGQKRFKLLDCSRKGILKLKGARLQVYMAQLMNESDDEESWLSITTMMELTGLSNKTIVEARKWLDANGYQSDTGRTGSTKYTRATHGAHKVKVIQMTYPTTHVETTWANEISEELGDAHVETTRGELLSIHYKNYTQGFLSGIVKSGSVSSHPVACSRVVGQPTASLQQVSNEPPTTPSLRETKPEEQKLLVPSGKGSLIPSGEKKSRPDFNCPLCEFSHRSSSFMVIHIRKNHPELGEQCFPVECPVDGCNWSTNWNKVNGNKSEKELDLVEHIEKQHTPDSLNYNPYWVCTVCGFADVTKLASEESSHRCPGVKKEMAFAVSSST
jgi:hypothetical protein